MKPPEFASHWAQELGTARESLVQLRGGINNHVFRCGSHGHHWVIKGYPSQQPGQRDRMQAEVEFLRYAQLVAPGKVPELLVVDTDRRCVVLEHLEGTAYPEGISPPAEDVQAAVDFFRQLNANLGLARQMIRLDAAEGFLSLREHMANVRERLAAMGTEHLESASTSLATELLSQLQKQVDEVQNNIEARIISGEVKDTIDDHLCCVSPSDFGFHNAILTKNGITFIDFEFAGWDDPAKACIDFILQQRNPIATKHLAILSAPYPNTTRQLKSRINVLYNLLRLKWICIILGILNPVRLQRMLASTQEHTKESLERLQLKRCIDYINLHLPYEPPQNLLL